MKVSLIIQDLFRQGAQYVTALVARGLISRGYDVDLVVSKVHDDIQRSRPDLKPFEVPESVRMIHLKNRKASCNIIELTKYFKREKPDIVVTMSSTYDIAVGFAMWLCPVRRPRFVIVEHNGGLECQPHQSWIQKTAKKIWIHFADALLLVSKGQREILLRRGTSFSADRLIVVRNPAVDDAFMDNLRAGPKHPWLQNKTGFTFVSAGALCELKRFDVLIKAFSMLPDSTARLIIFGEGPLSGALQRLSKDLGVADRVSFPGFTNNLPAEIKNADAFVLCSMTESFSIVIVEALAAGVPVLSTDCPVGPPEILEHGKYGLMCPVDDPAGLSEIMGKALEGHAIKPVPEAWSRYTLEGVIDNYELAFKVVLEGRNKGK